MYFKKNVTASYLPYFSGILLETKHSFLLISCISCRSVLIALRLSFYGRFILSRITLPEINTLGNHTVTSLFFRRSRTEWSNFLNRSPERFNIKIPELPSEKDQRFVGYAVRYLRPEVTRSWRVRYFFPA